ncbi:thiazolylpeptide-type bacteriocin [Actinosynnema sp. NPDC002837]
MDLTFEVEDLVLDELAVTTIADTTLVDGDPVASTACSCCSSKPHVNPAGK